MFEELKKYLIEKFGLAADSNDVAVKEFAAAKVKSGDLDLDKYMELLNAKSATSVDDIVARITSQVTESLKSTVVPPAAPPAQPEPPRDFAKEYAELEARILKQTEEKFAKIGEETSPAKLFAEMAVKDLDDSSPVSIRVKGKLEGFGDTKTAMTYKSGQDKLVGRYGEPIVYNGKEVNASTDRSKMKSATWAKFQAFPEHMKEWENEIVQHILHTEKFHVPSSDPGATDARLLTPQERQDVWHAHKNFYNSGRSKAPLIDDSTSGGEYSVPEFFDMDMIIAPTLASENIAALCNIVPVPRGSSAHNFILGRPTVTTEPEGVAADVFDATGFITTHDTPFNRVAGFVEIGLNYEQDAHPRIVQEIYNQYRASSALWMHEQITTGDGSVEPLGILNTPSVVDIPAAAGTGGAVGITDVINLLFGVSKAYRMNGASNRAVYIMTETLYKRIRSIATGVTGDQRLLFGMDVEGYSLFGHPVKIEEGGLTNAKVIFAQMAGYRLYMRQGIRLIRENRGATLVRNNTELVGVDFRVGGRLDLPGYAAVIDDLAA